MFSAVSTAVSIDDNIVIQKQLFIFIFFGTNDTKTVTVNNYSLQNVKKLV